MRAAFDESLRWDSPSRMAGRMAMRDVEIDGVVIPKGERCGLMFAAANRDPRKFQDPDRYDIKRDNRGHVGWGYGVHCVRGPRARAARGRGAARRDRAARGAIRIRGPGGAVDDDDRPRPGEIAGEVVRGELTLLRRAALPGRRHFAALPAKLCVYATYARGPSRPRLGHSAYTDGPRLAVTPTNDPRRHRGRGPSALSETNGRLHGRAHFHSGGTSLPRIPCLPWIRAGIAWRIQPGGLADRAVRESAGGDLLLLENGGAASACRIPGRSGQCRSVERREAWRNGRSEKPARRSGGGNAQSRRSACEAVNPERTPSAQSRNPESHRRPGRSIGDLCEIAKKLPGVEESTSYGTPALKVKGRMLARLRSEAEGALALRCGLLDQQILLQADPDTCFSSRTTTSVIRWCSCRLDRVRRSAMKDLLLRAWRQVAPPKLVAEYDAAEKR